MTFTDAGVLPALVGALAKEGISEPMPIQELAIPLLLAGKDAYLRSETGTGKTLAYLLPLFCRMDAGLAATQAIVVAPTHELAIQIQQQALRLAQNSGLPFRILLLIGQTSLTRQLDKLKAKPHLVIGSPGRILDLIGMKKVKMPAVKCVVVDEADRLLCGEQLEAVQGVVKAAPRNRQLLFVSATEQDAGLAEAQALAPGLQRLHPGENQVNRDIEHLYFVCEERDKADLLRRLLRTLEPARALVFVHRNHSAERVAETMKHFNLAAADLHACRDKFDRKQAMDAFRTGRANVLIASDLAARGLDFKGVSHVFNFDVPTLSLDYLHRAGRTGRAGVHGYAISLMTEPELRLVNRYTAELKITMMAAVLRGGQVERA
jgi:superfamily II DNA/RNA helicase